MTTKLEELARDVAELSGIPRHPGAIANVILSVLTPLLDAAGDALILLRQEGLGPSEEASNLEDALFQWRPRS